MGPWPRIGDGLRRQWALTATAVDELSSGLPGRGVGRRGAVGVSVGIALWGNGVVVAGRFTGQPEWVTLVGHPAAALAAVVWMRRRGAQWPALGLGPPRLPRDPLPVALTAGAVLWAAAWLAAGTAGVRDVSTLRLARLVVGTALAEEVLHRGVLPAAWAATGCPARTVVLANVATFGAWHAAGAIRGGVLHPLELAGPALGAVVLLWLRMRTGSVLPPAAVHVAGNLTGLAAVASA